MQYSAHLCLQLHFSFFYYTSRKKNKALEKTGLEKERGRRAEMKRKSNKFLKKHKGGKERGGSGLGGVSGGEQGEGQGGYSRPRVRLHGVPSLD